MMTMLMQEDILGDYHLCILYVVRMDISDRCAIIVPSDTVTIKVSGKVGCNLIQVLYNRWS